jgi:hypothetical protein
LSSTDKFLKVPLRGTFKIFSGFYNGAKRCSLGQVDPKEDGSAERCHPLWGYDYSLNRLVKPR